MAAKDLGGWAARGALPPRSFAAMVCVQLPGGKE
jgi:hypothetical protein